MQFAAIFTFLTTILGPLVVKVLTSLGIGAVSYVGINMLLDQVKSYVVSSFGGAGADTLALLGLAKVDIAVNIVLSAVTARAVYAGMNAASGTIKKLGSINK
ncbi:DUF2523 domain-containing protein [Pseudomonas sp. 2FE]|uniref:DUF2523 domain-containing protein n=1 Tax=Pseudomonas sp. 2FE TaxID=2502190 RepID=UPI0010F85A9E|nr:DUF2523 domain-containing protein [Pseudomonas sp. 2FE]